MTARFSGTALAFAIEAVAEIVAFVLVGNTIGFGYAVLLVLATSLIGAWLLKREGTRAWRRFREVQATGERPGRDLSRAVVGLGAALLLITPGFITDAVGLLLLVPPLRAMAARGVTSVASRRLTGAVAGDLFGPRRVRVRTGRVRTGRVRTDATVSEPGSTSVRTVPVRTVSGPTSPGGSDWSDAIEGEIVDQR